MTTFKGAALQPQATVTENLMPAFDKTGSTFVDYFYGVGGCRKYPERATALFSKAFNEDKNVASRLLFWSRDVRGGAGERESFRETLRYLERADKNVLMQLLPFVPEYGRWDDLLIFSDSAVQKKAFELIAQALQQENGLAAKWMPRKGELAVKLREYMHLSPKAYRKTLVRLSNVVEQKMCAGDWHSINFEHVPSVAAKMYQKAFNRHAPDAYAAYRESLSKGEAKINASAIFPHDVIRGIRHGVSDVAVAQWEALPNYLGDSKILPLVDVSGSMCTPINDNGVWSDDMLTCLDVAVSLGLYLADKQTGDFSDMFMTFSAKPQLQVLTGNIVSKMHQMVRSHWEMNTNIEAAFDAILQHALTNRVAEIDMPKYILILSDMQFDQCVRTPNDTAFQAVARRFYEAGYALPKVIFWNLNDRAGNAPVKFTESGTALLSGYSPAILKNLLAHPESLDPLMIVMDVVNSPRYAVINVA